MTASACLAAHFSYKFTQVSVVAVTFKLLAKFFADLVLTLYMEKNVIVDVVPLVLFFLVLFSAVTKKKSSIHSTLWNRHSF